MHLTNHWRTPMDKAQRELRKLAKKYGLNLERSGKSHFIFRNDDGAIMATHSCSSSDVRGIKNLKALLARGVG